MHVHKPDHVLLNQAYHTINKQAYVFITIGYLYDGTDLVNEAQAWPYIDGFDTQEPFDSGLKKMRGTFGVIGSAYAANPTGQMRVTAQIGSLKKQLAVFGDRHWQQGITLKPSEPVPFTKMPINLANAFGGPESPDNIYGKGYPNSEDAVGRPLPNIELIENPILSLEDKPALATLGVIPAASRMRSTQIGKLDNSWFHNDCPWLPVDTQPGWFDQVSADQHITDYWRGTESWSVVGMHPTKHEITGQLPGLRPRLLVRQEQIYESGLDLDTVYLFPDTESVLIMYRAAVAVKREDGADIHSIAVFTEQQNQAKTDINTLIEQWQKNIDTDLPVPVPVGLAASADAMPNLSADPDFAQLKSADEIQSEIITKVESGLDEGEQLRNNLLDDVAKNSPLGSALDIPRMQRPDFAAILAGAGATSVPDMANWESELTSRITRELEQEKQNARQTLAKLTKDAGLDPQDMLDAADASSANAASQADMRANETATEFVQGLEIPDYLKDEIMPGAQKLDAEMSSVQQTLAGVRQQIDDLYASLPDAYGGLVGVLQKGQNQNVAKVLEHVRQGNDLTEAELTGLDFSGQDLSNVVFDGAVIKDCNFANAILSGTSFKNAMLESCNLSGADISQSTWQFADLKGSDFTGIKAEQASFTNASINECQFNNAALQQSDLSSAMVGESSFKSANLQGAILNTTTFWQTDASGANFTAAQADGLRIDTNSIFIAVNFSQAQLANASWQDTDFSNSNLNETNLNNAFVSNCNMSNTTAWRMLAKNAMFKNSTIANANWSVANLMQANFDYAILQSVNLGGANLYAIETRTAQIQDLLLDGALLDRSRLAPDFKEVSL